jgi:hypothetical protein
MFEPFLDLLRGELDSRTSLCLSVAAYKIFVRYRYWRDRVLNITSI